jgi:transposase
LQSPASSGVYTQKKSYLYRERNEEQRRVFLEQLALIPARDRVYIDEAGVEDTLDYPYGWSPRGTRCPAEKFGHRTQRISMVAAWCCGNVLAPFTFQGYCDSMVVETWFEKFLLPVLRPGQVVILDNASFHRKTPLRELLHKVGCGLLALPTYSPDLNKIEPLWHTIKQRIRFQAQQRLSLWDKVDAAFCSL